MHFIAVCVGHTVFLLERAITAHPLLLSEITGKLSLFQKHYITTIRDLRVSAEMQQRHSIAYLCSLSYLCWMEII